MKHPQRNQQHDHCRPDDVISIEPSHVAILTRRWPMQKPLDTDL
jgi:hypothetical protein